VVVFHNRKSDRISSEDKLENKPYPSPSSSLLSLSSLSLSNVSKDGRDNRKQISDKEKRVKFDRFECFEPSLTESNKC
jgi:hypothetical protein